MKNNSIKLYHRKGTLVTNALKTLWKPTWKPTILSKVIANLPENENTTAYGIKSAFSQLKSDPRD